MHTFSLHYAVGSDKCILFCVLCPRSTFAHATLICTFLTNQLHIFTMWHYASAVYAVTIVCLSQVKRSIKMSKWLNIISHKHHRMVMWCQTSWQNSSGVIQTRALNAWSWKNLQLSTNNSETVQETHIFLWKMNRKSYMLYRMITLSMTLSYANLPKSSVIFTFWLFFISLEREKLES